MQRNNEHSRCPIHCKLWDINRRTEDIFIKPEDDPNIIMVGKYCEHQRRNCEAGSTLTGETQNGQITRPNDQETKSISKNARGIQWYPPDNDEYVLRILGPEDSRRILGIQEDEGHLTMNTENVCNVQRNFEDAGNDGRNLFPDLIRFPEENPRIPEIQENGRIITIAQHMKSGPNRCRNSVADRITQRISENVQTFQFNFHSGQNTATTRKNGDAEADIEVVWSSIPIQPHGRIPPVSKEPRVMKEFYIQESDPINIIRILKHIKRVLEMKQSYIFCKYEHTANTLASYLRAIGISCGSAGEDPNVYDLFNSGFVRALILTDETSKTTGNLKPVPFLINYDFPETPEFYTERRGLVGHPSGTPVGMEITHLMIVSFASVFDMPIISELLSQFDLEELPW